MKSHPTKRSLAGQVTALNPFNRPATDISQEPRTKPKARRQPSPQSVADDAAGLAGALIKDQPRGTLYGYARVSTDAQDLSNQVAQLKAAGCATIFREKMSGATAERPQLKRLMARLDAGDVVVIPAVGRR